MAVPITGTALDTEVARNLEVVSREIDDLTGRRFFTTTADETRYYTARHAGTLTVDDLISVTSLATDSDGDRTYEDTWAVTDYDLYPYNATLDGKPYWRLNVTPAGDYAFPPGVPKGVKIVGKFGYCAIANVPSRIKAACIIRAAMLLNVPLAPYGTIGLGEAEAQQVNANPYGVFRGLLDPFRRVEVG